MKTSKPLTSQNSRLKQAVKLQQMGKLKEALICYQKLQKSYPQDPRLLANLGAISLQLGKFSDSVHYSQASIAIDRRQPVVLANLAFALARLQRFAEAVTHYEQALILQPDYAEAYFNRANIYKDLRRFEDAIPDYERAIAIQPDYLAAHYNLGQAYKELNEFSRAIDSYQRVIALKPDLAEAHYNYGLAYFYLQQYPAALSRFQQALTLKPDYDFLPGYCLHTKLQIADWQNLEQERAELYTKVACGQNAVHPFIMHGLVNSPELQRMAAEVWSAEKFGCQPPPDYLSAYPEHTKIRLGYFSADFREHPVTYLTAKLYERHDRQQFEVIAFSYGPDTKDAMRIRLEAGFDRFIDVQHLTDQQVITLARSLEIDIAVDLGGYTTDSRPAIFADRVAPVQVSYIGYLGTMGAGFMDYLLADPVLIPAAYQRHYAEKVIYLPSYQANDSQRRIADTPLTRQQLGLPENGFVFCCFNSTYKLTPETFSGWMRILSSVAGSVLLLYAEHDITATNLKNAAQARGIDAQRLVFANNLPVAEYLARYRLADLFLDTLPYNAGTTASDALWAGLPVLTCSGQAFASRMAASLLTAIGLPELITTTQDEYEAKAIALASQPEQYARIRHKLQQNRLTTALFDSKQFTLHLETAYRQIHARQCAGLAPETMHVQAVQLKTDNNPAMTRPSFTTQAVQRAESLFITAWNHHQQGDFEQARAAYQQAIELYPQHYDALHFLGVLETQAGNYSQAVDWISKAVSVDSNDPAAYFNLGIAQKNLQQHQAALHSYNRALALADDFVEAYNNRGNLLTELEEYTLAEDSYQRALALKPDYAEAYNNLGTLYKILKQYPLALENYQQAIVCKADYAEAYFNLANLLEAGKQYDAALLGYEQALALNPDSVECLIACGNLYDELKDYPAALAYYERAIRLKPDFAPLYNNCGNVYKALAQTAAAMRCYDQAIDLQADYAEAYQHRGCLYKHNGQLAQAIQDFQRAIAIKPDFADAHFSLGLCLLQLGDYAQGWLEYEWRWRRQNLPVLQRKFITPCWTGREALVGKTLFLYSEQGLGDTLQFCRYLKPVADRGAKIILDVQQPLHGLFDSFRGSVELLPYGADFPDFDYHCSLLSLPLAFATLVDSIPNTIPYLHSDAGKALSWQQRLGEKNRPRIGLVWSGNPGFENDINRSVNLAEFVEILPGDNCQYICLQKELRETDRQTLQAHPELLFFGDELEDFTDTAALASCMDLVVSTCTSVPHLTAAMAIPTWILLSANPDWRWLLERNDSPWYPGVKLFRQPGAGDWSAVFQQVRAGLILLSVDYAADLAANKLFSDLAVISLSGTPERLARFKQVNKQLRDYRIFQAVEGSQLTPRQLLETGYCDASLRYNPGALGCALSHISLWRQAVNSKTAITICEDDAILHADFQELAAQQLAKLPADWDLILWGWNFDSILLAELLPELGDSLLYFDQQTMREKAFNYTQQTFETRHYRLKQAMGIPCYSISSAGAAKFLRHVLPLRNMELQLDFGGLIQTVSNAGIDIMMNVLYPETNSYVVFPPLVLTGNLKEASTVQVLS